MTTLVRDLRRRRGRERRALALAEGIRLVEEAVAAGRPLRGAVQSPALEATSRGRALKAALAERGIPSVAVTDAELAELADTEQPQGIVAVIEPAAWSLAEIPLAPGAVVLVLDAVQDPGNVGALARTALGLGAAGLVALPGTADLTNPKVLRASMGALFRLPAVMADAEAVLVWAAEHGAELWVTAADGTPPPTPGGRPVLLVMGNEGAGIGEALAARAARRVGIPLAAGVESLNVAVAAGILLHEVRHGR